MSFQNKKILYLNSVAGVAGDMFAASFVDAGLIEARVLENLPQLLDLPGVQVQIKKVMKASVQATHLNVEILDNAWKKHFGESGVSKPSHAFVRNPHASEDHNHWHSSYVLIDRFLANSPLPQEVKSLAQKIFYHIGLVESEAHGVLLEKVSFHEIGTVDSILDVVMAALCLHTIDADEIYASPLRLGRGFVKIAHGTHPIPPPATLKLLEGMPLAQTPSAIERENVELTTPTGAAILKTLFLEKRLRFSPELPSGVLKSSGCGAGTMDLGNFPNIFRLSLLEGSAVENNPSLSSVFLSDEVYEIACNIDDDSSEKVSWITEKLLSLGALDVWTTPSLGKKGRLVHCLELLCFPLKQEELMNWLLCHSSTFGVRYQKWQRYTLDREVKQISTPYGPMRIKLGKNLEGKILKQKIEFEDLKKVLEKNPDFKLTEIV